MNNKSIQAYGRTDVGLMRTINQDSIYVSVEPVGKLPNLFIVADGMGGHKAGDVASRVAIDNFIRYVCTTHMSDPANIMDSGIISINRDIYELALSNKDYSGMGTTFVAATLIDNHVYVANVGDSRLYLVGDRSIQQITRDHSLVENMVKMGMITREEARNSYNKNVITKAVGTPDDKSSMPDIFEIEIEKGDRLLLCSDGLTNMVDDFDIKRIIVNADSMEEAVYKLIDTANENGGMDNISALIVEYDGDRE